MSMQVVSTVTKVVSVGPKHNSAPPSASGSRRATFPHMVGDRKVSLASNVSDGRRKREWAWACWVVRLGWFNEEYSRQGLQY